MAGSIEKPIKIWQTPALAFLRTHKHCSKLKMFHSRLQKKKQKTDRFGKTEQTTSDPKFDDTYSILTLGPSLMPGKIPVPPHNIFAHKQKPMCLHLCPRVCMCVCVKTGVTVSVSRCGAAWQSLGYGALFTRAKEQQEIYTGPQAATLFFMTVAFSLGLNR